MTSARANFISRRRRREQRAGVSYYDPLLDLLVTTGHPENTAILHERIHFFDHISTSFGCILDDIVAVTTRGWGQLLHDARETGVYIPVPFDRLIRGEVVLEESQKEQQEAFFARISVAAITHDLLAGLIDAMHGDSARMVTAAPTVSALAALERMMETGAALPDLADVFEDLPTWERPELLSPEVKWGREVADKTTRIGARALLEGRAMIAESALAPDFRKHFMRALEQGAPEYVTAIDIVHQEVAALDEHAESYPTFLALSDLALMTTAAPGFSAFRERRRWTDVHPGYRFMDLLGLIREIGRYDPEADPFEYQAKFCRKLNWPDPRDVLEFGAQLKGDDYRTARRREAFERKLESPDLFMVGQMPQDGNALRELFDEFEPHTCVYVNDSTLRATNEINDGNVDELLLRLGYTYLFDLGERLMECEDPIAESVDWLEAFDDRLQVGDEHSLRRFFDNTYAAGVEFRAIRDTPPIET